MNLIKKYGPLVSIGLIVLTIGFLFLPYVRTGYANSYYALGYQAIFNIKDSGLTSNTTRDGGPSVMLILAFVLMSLSLLALPFHKKDLVIAFAGGIALLLAGVIFFFGHLILIVNLKGAPIQGTFGLYLVATLVTLAGVSSLLAGIQTLKESRKNSDNKSYSYIKK